MVDKGLSAQVTSGIRGVDGLWVTSVVIPGSANDKGVLPRITIVVHRVSTGCPRGGATVAGSVVHRRRAGIHLMGGAVHARSTEGPQGFPQAPVDDVDNHRMVV